MKKIFIVLISVLLIAANAFALEGDYKIDGQGQDGSKYAGTVVISKKGTVYLLNWLIAKTGEQYKGIGLLTDNVLSVSWGSAAAIGVVSYKVEGTKLVGNWASAAGLTGKETLIKQ